LLALVAKQGLNGTKSGRDLEDQHNRPANIGNFSNYNYTIKLNMHMVPTN